jgi:hypothetical protein
MKNNKKICPVCIGNGEVECPLCDGTGKEKCPNCGGTGSLSFGRQCIRCNATGYIEEDCRQCNGTKTEQCKLCNGRGRIEKRNRLLFQIGRFIGSLGFPLLFLILCLVLYLQNTQSDTRFFFFIMSLTGILYYSPKYIERVIFNK